MPAIAIRTSLFPLRFQVKGKPVELTVEIINNGEKTKMISLEIFLPHALGFDKGSLNKGVRKRIGNIKPGETQKMRFEIYPSPVAQKGTYTAEVNVLEHHEDFSQVIKVYSREFDCRIIK